MKIDLDKRGLEMWLKPYETELMRVVFAAAEPVDTRTAWSRLKAHPMSRATVINFLQRMAAEGWLHYAAEGSRGGMKGVYAPSGPCPCESALVMTWALQAVEALGRAVGVTFVEEH